MKKNDADNCGIRQEVSKETQQLGTKTIYRKKHKTNVARSEVFDTN